MEQDSWGPKFWFVIESSVINLQNERTHLEKYAEFIQTLSYIVPCSECSEHITKYIADNPIPTTDKEDLIEWVKDFHNSVRERTGKRKFSKNDIIQYYMTYKYHTLFTILLMIFCLIIVSSLRD